MSNSNNNNCNEKKTDIPESRPLEILSENTINNQDTTIDITVNSNNLERSIINESGSSQSLMEDKPNDKDSTIVTIKEDNAIGKNIEQQSSKQEVLYTVIVEGETPKKEDKTKTVIEVLTEKQIESNKQEELHAVIVEGKTTNKKEISKTVIDVLTEKQIECNKQEDLEAVIVEEETTKKGGNVKTGIDVLNEKHTEPFVAGRKKSFWVFSQPGNWSAPPHQAYPSEGGWGPQYGPPSYNDAPLEYEPGRNEFVRYVFTLVFIMLATTASIVTLVYMTQPAFFFSPLGLFLFIMCMIIHMCVHYALLCSECSKLPPTCYILLVIGTLAMSMICSIICLRYAPFIILGAVLATTATVGLCLGLAYTSFDFTKFILIVVVASFALLFAAMTCAILSSVFGIRTTMARLVITCISAVVSSVVLVIEFQMILGGRNVELTIDDYAFAAWLVYTSIIDIFLKMLMILGHAFGDE